MTVDTINMIEVCIERLNTKQVSIARALVADSKNFTIFPITKFGITELAIREASSGKDYVFIDYVISKCGCP